jgi:AraC-like DNA-binding protein
MIYRNIAPAPVLQEYVRDYLIAHFVFEDHQPIPVKAFAPRTEQAITFLPRGYLTIHSLQNGKIEIAPSASICGQQLCRYNFHLTKEYMMFRINFRPGVLYRLLGIPLSEFVDSWFDAELATNREMIEVNDRLANAPDYKTMVDIVEKYLTEKIKKIKTDTHPLDKVAGYILANTPRVSLDWLADQSCLCQRQFNRKFNERIGIGPKLFSRVVRFFNAYKYQEANPKDDWLTVALLFGYTDYQHMVKDFKKFANVSPRLWVNQDTRSPERILRLT